MKPLSCLVRVFNTLLLVAPLSGLLLHANAQATNFGPVNVGATSTVTPVTLTFNSDGTIGSTAVVTQGSAGLDFSDAGSGTCAVGVAYTADQTCSVNVSFAPRFPGTRYGAVVAHDTNGNTIATAYLQGTGIGPQVSFLPGTETPIVSSGLSYPSGVALDGSGNVYFVDTGNTRVVKATPGTGGYTLTAVTSGLSQGGAYGIAVDGAGNVYVGDTGNQRILKEVPTSGGYVESVIASGFGYPMGLAVDASGDVFAADQLSDRILEFVPSAGGYTQSIAVTGVPNVYGVAVDGSGNLYVAAVGYFNGTSTNSAVYKETLTPNGYVQSTLPGAGQVQPLSIAVDGTGNVYVVDGASPNIYKETPTPTGYVQSAVVTDLNAIGGAFGVGVDESRNLFIGYAGANSVLKSDLADPPALNFASTPVGTTSPDSPLTVALGNNGNAPLLLEVPTTGTNPSISANFTLDGSGASACQVTPSGASSPFALNPATSCLLPIDYTPAVSGPVTGALLINDNNLNAPAPAYASQSVTLNGTSTTPTFTVSASPTSISLIQGNSYSSTITITPQTGFTVNASLSVSGLPSGVTASFSQNPASGSSVLTFTASSTAAPGNATVTVTGTFGSISETATINLQVAATPDYYLTLSASPSYLNVAPGTSGSAAITTTTKNGYDSAITLSTCSPPITGATVTFTPSTIAAPGNGSSTMTIAVSPNGAVAYNGTTGSFAICVQAGGPGVDQSMTFWLYVRSTPVITWSTPAPITYGTALGTSQLDATANVPGTFSYSPAIGTVLTAGSQTLNVTFTPTDTNDYTTATSTVPLTVNKATPALSWPAPTAITYGTALSASQLDATANVPGTFAYSPAAGTVLASGQQTLNVTFTPTDGTDYTTASTTARLTVNKATPVISWPTPAPIVYGTVLSAIQLDATANVQGTFAYTPAAGTILAVGTNTLNVVFTPTDTADYATATGSVTLVVNPPPSYSLTASPSSLSIKEGSSASSTIRVNAINGFAGAVNLSISGLPKGVTATISPNPATTMSSITFTVGNKANLGTTPITVTGKSGSIIQTAMITLTVAHK